MNPVCGRKSMFKNHFRHKRLTRELCANRLRFYKLAYSWTGDPMLADDLVQEAMQKPQRHVDEQDTSAMVRQCIARLSEKHRDVITLVDLMEFSYEEVSQALEIPIGTVMSRLCRARRQLKQLITRASEQPDLPKPIQPLRSVQ